MNFHTYKVVHIHLSKVIQYILFNYSNDPSNNSLITSYANNNICLGILKEKVIINDTNGTKKFQNKPGIQTYISAMYLEPHRFQVNGVFDEICIDLTPVGYYHLFKKPLKTYMLEDNFLAETWGNEAILFFEKVFEKKNFTKRGQMIEEFLVRKIQSSQNIFLMQCMHYIHSNSSLNLENVSRNMQCSQKKIIRTFQQYLDLTPKDYMKILRFRKALWFISYNKVSLTDVTYECGYYDQSHFIKDIRFFTGLQPKQLYSSLHNVNNDVLISL